LRTVLDRQLGHLRDQRRQLLERAGEQYGEQVPVSVLLEAALRPDLELLARLRKHKVEVARVLGRAHTRPGAAVAAYVEQQFQTLARQLTPMLQRSLPEVDQAELRLRLRL